MNARFKLMQARYDARCVDCGGYIQAGDTIKWDGKVHHADSDWCAGVQAEAKQRANWNAVADGFMPPYPEEY
jgi:hypothetical protein